MNQSRSIEPRHPGRFLTLPGSRLAWTAAAVAFAYIVLAAIMANTVLGLPTWLDFVLGLVPGAAAAILMWIVMVREHEHSWLLWLGLAGLVFYLGQWLVMILLAV